MADEAPKAAVEVIGTACGIDEAVTKRVKGRARRFVALYQRSVEEGWEVGRELVEAKKQIEHGYWIPWIETQIGLARRTAQRLMDLYTRDPEKRHVTQFASTSEALRLLPPVKSKREDGSARSGG